MKGKLALLAIIFILTIGSIVITTPLVMGKEVQVAPKNQDCAMKDCPMMRGGRMGADMPTIRQLFANHDRIRRSVEEIPGGIRAVTESDDPEVAATIKRHVSSMYQRLADNRGIPMMMSPTLPVMSENANRYQRDLKITDKGVVITETSSDPKMVAVIREHGREINNFVAKGMSAMMGGMMR